VTETITADDVDLVRPRAGALLSEGRLVVAPTDTAYAVLADAFQMDATQRVFDARRAERGAPLPVIVRSPRQLAGLVKTQTEQSERLMAAFWPGALTLVFHANEGLAWDLGAISADDIFAAATGALEWGNPTGDGAATPGDDEEAGS
jgi:L-threonylcarbamoyladenylate synthase